MINLDETPEIKELSPGKLLLQGRLQVGLSQEQVAKELYLTVSKVIALESDDFDRVGPDTFVRGYIRAYSNILKLDAAKILAAYENCLKKKSQSSSNVTAPVNVVSNKRAWKFGAFVAITFVGLWLISIWFFDSPSDSPTEKNYVLPAEDIPSLVNSVDNFAAASAAASISIEQQSSVSESLATSSESSIAASVETQSATAASVSTFIAPVSVNNNSSKKSASVSAIAKSSISTAAVKPAATNKNGLDEINFIFRSECWLEVSDSRGDVLATELQAAGSKLTLVGKAPFDVKLGNASAVAIQLNGKKVAVTPVPGSRVLTLKLDGN